MKGIELLKRWNVGRGKTTLKQRKIDWEYLCKVVIPQLLVAGETVHLPGVGRLKVTTRQGRTGRNPRTGEPINIPAKRKVVLVMEPAMERVLNK